MIEKLHSFKHKIKLLLLFLLIALNSGCSIWKGYTPDNQSEELIEGIIDHYTGLNLDLSPNSLE